MGAAMLANNAYDDQLQTGASLLLRYALDVAEGKGVNLTGAMWRRGSGSIEELTLASGAWQMKAEFASDVVAAFPSRHASGVRRLLRSMVEELAESSNLGKSAANLRESGSGVEFG
jgi:hypothetical protein